MTEHPWMTEQEVALDAVRRAATICRAVRGQMVGDFTLHKADRSPVTVADFASQAAVCACLNRSLPNDRIVGEENADPLRQQDAANMRRAVTDYVSQGMGQSTSEDQVLDWIDRASAGDGPSIPPPNGERFWALDPIDGTKGFLRGGQYAVALALIEHSRVVLGVLGCPNFQQDPAGSDATGTLLIAVHGHGTRVLPIDPTSPQDTQPVRVSSVTDPGEARICESVESRHSNHSTASRIAQGLGIHRDPVRMDSQAKYAAIACGQASIYLRLPTRADYREMIWDHAAGSITVQEAGGCVTDIHGRPLDFTHGKTLQANRGVVATNGTLHEQVIHTLRQVTDQPDP